jgi:peptidoglycan/xylan/chitin deacetylase (PgdA/CDA1 family)
MTLPARHGRRATVAACLLLTIACTGPSRAAAGSSSPPPACTITGTASADHLVGTEGDDVICGLGGNDVIAAGSGDDAVYAGPGEDNVDGGQGADLIRGGGGDDSLNGGHGADAVRSEGGDDRVSGGLGRDHIFGGVGNDRIAGRDHQPYDHADAGVGTNLCVIDSSDTRRGCNHPLDPSHRRGVPVLMYHVIARATSSTPLAYLWVAPRVFAAQMRWLDRHHYHVVTLQEVYDYWHGAPLPSRPIVVSFDDGFRNHLTQAMPILDRHGWGGTLNLALSHYHQPGWGLGPKAIHRLLRHDWELDSHTMTHLALPGLSASALTYQVNHSRSVLRHLFHVPVDFFCYPAGAYDGRAIAAVRAAGYQAATSTEDGLARWNDPWTLDRVRINSGDGVTGLASHLRSLGLPG